MSDRISERPSIRIVSGSDGGGTGAGGKARRFWGMTARQRLERALARAGAAVSGAAAPQGGGPHVLIRDDYIFDQMLIPALLLRPGILLTGPHGEAVAAHVSDLAQVAAIEPALASGDSTTVSGLQRIDSVGLASSYNKSLRRR